jgi:hypothetical protein
MIVLGPTITAIITAAFASALRYDSAASAVNSRSNGFIQIAAPQVQPARQRLLAGDLVRAVATQPACCLDGVEPVGARIESHQQVRWLGGGGGGEQDLARARRRAVAQASSR